MQRKILDCKHFEYLAIYKIFLGKECIKTYIYIDIYIYIYVSICRYVSIYNPFIFD